jgi:hypothetical protein
MSRIGGLYRRLNEWVKLQGYKAEYYLESRSDYFLHTLRGGCSQSRLSYHSQKEWHSCGLDGPESTDRVAFFVAFHPNKEAPASNIRYIRALRKCGFAIVYVHNGPLEESSIEKLQEHCWNVICRENIGQDFGAWKDAYIEYTRLGKLDKTNWLLICNDSNYFLGARHGDEFTELMRLHLSNEDSDLICSNLNQEMWPHYQSFFLCFHRRVFTSESFSSFWREYKPFTNRYYAINAGEIKLTSTVLHSAKAAILYQSPSCAFRIKEASATPAEILKYAPKHCLFLVNQLSQASMTTRDIKEIDIHRILSLLDLYNPSHAYALLFSKFSLSPFLKKDLVKHGVFSLTQIANCLESSGFSIDSLAYNEIMSGYIRTSNHTSFVNRRRQAYRQGINPENGVQFTAYPKSLKALGFRLD